MVTVDMSLSEGVYLMVPSGKTLVQPHPIPWDPSAVSNYSFHRYQEGQNMESGQIETLTFDLLSQRTHDAHK